MMSGSGRCKFEKYNMGVQLSWFQLRTVNPWSESVITWVRAPPLPPAHKYKQNVCAQKTNTTKYGDLVQRQNAKLLISIKRSNSFSPRQSVCGSKYRSHEPRKRVHRPVLDKGQRGNENGFKSRHGCQYASVPKWLGTVLITRQKVEFKSPRLHHGQKASCPLIVNM